MTSLSLTFDRMCYMLNGAEFRPFPSLFDGDLDFEAPKLPPLFLLFAASASLGLGGMYLTLSMRLRPGIGDVSFFTGD